MTSERVFRTAEGAYRLGLTAGERAFLRSLAPDMREALEDDDDPAVRRLFPTAYPEDDDRQEEYRLLVHDELKSSYRRVLDVLSDTADAEALDAEQLYAWMQALNHVRLVLGTRLDIREEDDAVPDDPDDPRLPAFAAYHYLTMLQAEVVEALE